MKRFISLLTALSITAMVLTGIPVIVSAADDGIAIDETNFPDEVFRNKVKGNSIDKNTDGKLSADEIADIKVLSVDNMSLAEENVIHNLKGIEFFTELTEFYCRFNSVSSLDLSKNTKLTEIICINSKIESLNVSNCTALSHLECGSNNLNALDVSSNTELTYLSCGSNQLTELNLRNNTALTDILCGGNLITELDISQNTALVTLNCIDNQLTNLDVSNNIALKNLHFSNNKISEVDLSQNTNLSLMMCFNNQLTALDLSGNPALNNLNCHDNQLIEIDLSNNPALEILQCYNNQITSLDVSKNPQLSNLRCNNNHLTSLDVSQSTKLSNFKYQDNTYTVSTCVLDPTKLPGNFDLSKASNWTNAVVTDDNKILSLAAGNATYTYDCGNGKTAEFTIVFPSRSCTKVEAKDADCTEDGNIEYYECTDCSSKFRSENPTSGADILSDEDVVIPAVGHTFETDWSKDETNHWYAATCGHDVTSEKAGHTWNEGVITANPTETAEGEKTYTCSVCSATKTEPVEKLEHTHNLKKTARVEPTCTDEGSEEYWTCADCKKMFSDENGTTEIDEVVVIPANGHTEVIDAAVEPTCTAAGKSEGKHCSVCDTVITAQTNIPAKGHSWDNGVITTPATEDSDGVKTFTCSACGVTKTETIPSLNHVHTLTHHERIDADCVNTGTVEYWSCSVCHNNYSDAAATQQLADITIPAKGHTVVTDAAVAATCTTDGKTEGSHCSVCNTVLTAQTNIPATGHSWDSGVVTTAPTASTDGVKTYTCTVCGATKTEKIPATGGTNPPSGNENGNITTEVQPGENVPATEVKTPKDELIDAVLTDEEKEQINNGVDIKIILKVEDGTDTVPAEDKANVEKKIGELPNYKLGQYLDVELLKIIGGVQEKITNTKSDITVTFDLPEALRKTGRTYSVIRVHDGITEVLPDLDNDVNTVTIETDKFSTYALAYSEKNGNTPPSGGNSGGSHPTTPTSYRITVNANEGGSVSGSGDYNHGDTAEISATPDSGYKFAGWYEDETLVSTSLNYSFTVRSSRTFTAKFEVIDDTSGDDNPTPPSSDESDPNESGDTSTDSNDETSGDETTQPSGDNSSTNESDTNTSDSTSSGDENNSAPSESAPSDNGENPATGIAISLAPPAVAFTTVVIAVKRKRNH